MTVNASTKFKTASPTTGIGEDVSLAEIAEALLFGDARLALDIESDFFNASGAPVDVTTGAGAVALKTAGGLPLTVLKTGDHPTASLLAAQMGGLLKLALTNDSEVQVIGVRTADAFEIGKGITFEANVGIGALDGGGVRFHFGLHNSFFFIDSDFLLQVSSDNNNNVPTLAAALDVHTMVNLKIDATTPDDIKFYINDVRTLADQNFSDQIIAGQIDYGQILIEKLSGGTDSATLIVDSMRVTQQVRSTIDPAAAAIA